MTGTDGQEFKPDNLVYLFDDKLSLSGLFQRMDNFLAKGFDEAMKKFRETCRHEKAELETTREALGREFPQIVDDVKLNHKTPLIIEIPDRHGTGRKPDFITGYVNEAIGLKL